MNSIYSKSVPRFDKPSPQFQKSLNIDETPYIETFDPLILRKTEGYAFPKLNSSNEKDSSNEKVKVKK